MWQPFPKFFGSVNTYPRARFTFRLTLRFTLRFTLRLLITWVDSGATGAVVVAALAFLVVLRVLIRLFFSMDMVGSSLKVLFVPADVETYSR